MLNRWTVRLLSASACSLVYLSLMVGSYGSALTIYFLDVGQGDAILIETPAGQRLLVDGGRYRDVVYELDSVLPFWQRDLELVMASHPDEDHVGGLINVLERYQVGLYLASAIDKKTGSSERIEDLLGFKGMSKQGFYAGQRLAMDEVMLTSWWPEEMSERRVTDTNGHSQVVELRYGDFSLLLTGDIDSQSLARLADTHATDVSVLKVPHHGSADGLSPSIVGRLQPEVAVISVGADNRYGHPHSSVVSLLTDGGVRTYRTDCDGRVRIEVNGAGFSVYPEKSCIMGGSK